MSRQPVVHITFGLLREQGLPGESVPVAFCGTVGAPQAAYCHESRACKACLRERGRFHRWLQGLSGPCSRGEPPWAA